MNNYILFYHIFWWILQEEEYNGRLKKKQIIKEMREILGGNLNFIATTVELFGKSGKAHGCESSLHTHIYQVEDLRKSFK